MYYKYNTYSMYTLSTFFWERRNMSTKKNKIVAYMEQEYHEKLKILAKRNERSVSKEVAYLIKQNIEKYEKEHGKIDISSITQWV